MNRRQSAQTPHQATPRRMHLTIPPAATAAVTPRSSTTPHPIPAVGRTPTAVVILTMELATSTAPRQATAAVKAAAQLPVTGQAHLMGPRAEADSTAGPHPTQGRALRTPPVRTAGSRSRTSRSPNFPSFVTVRTSTQHLAPCRRKRIDQPHQRARPDRPGHRRRSPVQRP